MTNKVFSDLALFMIAFGFSIGFVFPFFVIVLGVPKEYAFTGRFFTACIGAGLVAGGVNYYLARKIVGDRLKILSDVGLHMRTLAGSMRSGMKSSKVEDDELSHMISTDELCGEMGCQVEVDSDDEFGESAKAFNMLAQTLSKTIITERVAHSFSNMLATQLDLEPLAEKAVQKLMLYTGAVGGLLAVIEQGVLKIACAHGLKNTETILESDYVKDVLQTGVKRIIQLPEKHMISLDHVIGEHSTRHVIVDPVTYKGISLGVVILASEKEYDEEISHRLNILGSGLGLALNNSLTHGHLRRLATLDPLTGLFNRGFGVKRLHEEYSRSVRGDVPLGLILFDIDNFKQINDTYGHMVGDRVLIHVAKSARKMLREGDILTRYGGEEFMIVLPGASFIDVEQVAERVRHAIQDLMFMEEEQSVKVTVSLGGVSHPEFNVAHEDALIKHADEALYSAKEKGKNRTELAHPNRSL